MFNKNNHKCVADKLIYVFDPDSQTYELISQCAVCEKKKSIVVDSQTMAGFISSLFEV